VLKRILILVCLLAATGPLYLRAQEMPTESRTGELQIGLGYSRATPDYTDNHFYGPSLYATFDFRDHLGVEADFHDVKGNTSTGAGGDSGTYEKTYEVGMRYVWHPWRLDPYGKLLVGRGVFNYPYITGTTTPSANLAYNMYSVGFGVDLRTKRYLNIRLFDYELQKWGSFPPHGLTPQVITFGAAYRFH
jgi:hypothetical protein